MALSPMMKQYTEIKETVKDSILFFRENRIGEKGIGR